MNNKLKNQSPNRKCELQAIATNTPKNVYISDANKAITNKNIPKI